MKTVILAIAAVAIVPRLALANCLIKDGVTCEPGRKLTADDAVVVPDGWRIRQVGNDYVLSRSGGNDGARPTSAAPAPTRAAPDAGRIGSPIPPLADQPGTRAQAVQKCLAAQGLDLPSPPVLPPPLSAAERKIVAACFADNGVPSPPAFN